VAKTGISKHMGEWLGKMGRDGFAQEFPQQEQDPSWPGAREFEPSWVTLRGFGWWGQSLWRHDAALAPRCLLSLSARRLGGGLPVLDDLWVITADNEIFNHRLYYRG